MAQSVERLQAEARQAAGAEQAKAQRMAGVCAELDKKTGSCKQMEEQLGE